LTDVVSSYYDIVMKTFANTQKVIC